MTFAVTQDLQKHIEFSETHEIFRNTQDLQAHTQDLQLRLRFAGTQNICSHTWDLQEDMRFAATHEIFQEHTGFTPHRRFAATHRICSHTKVSEGKNRVGGFLKRARINLTTSAAIDREMSDRAASCGAWAEDFHPQGCHERCSKGPGVAGGLSLQWGARVLGIQ